MSDESKNQHDIWAAIGSRSRVFRINVGMAWVSGIGPKGIKRQGDGSVKVTAPRPMSVGLTTMDNRPVPGVSDLIGATSIQITPDMVGSRVAVLTCVEVKATGGGRVSPDQTKWLNFIRSLGGIAGVCSSADDAVQLIDSWRPPML